MTSGSVATPNKPLLAVSGLEAGYGLAQTLFGVSFDMRPGSVLAVLGANGAGKSTLGRTLSGLVQASAGSVKLDGQELVGRKAHRIRRDGLAYIPEGRGVFPGLSVVDNLKVSLAHVAGREARQEGIDYSFGMFPVLAERRTQRAGSLSGGEQQMLAMARTLCANPRVIIADEMSLGLAPKMVDVVFECLERARGTGITIVLIEQFVHRALELADDCLIMHRGSVVWSGAAADAGEEVLARYVGEESAVAVVETS